MQFTDLSPLPAVWAVLAVILALVYYKIRNRNILPGPRGLPYLGLWSFLDEQNLHLQLCEYGRKYGDMYSFTCCGRLFIHLGSVKAIRELHINHSEYFSEKFTATNVLTYTLGNGLAMINGENWKVLRKFFLQNLKEYGVTTTNDTMIGPMYDALPKLVDDLKALKGKPFNVLDMATDKCQGTLKKILFGENSISHEQIRLLNKAYTDLLMGFSGVNMLLIGPYARILFAILPKFRRALRNHYYICDTLNECIKEMEASFDEENPTCIIENYFKERNKRRRENDPTWKYFTDEALIETLSQFLGDGIVGTAALVACFLNALVEHPEEQRKIYDELVTVVGTNRLPSITDKSKLSYTTAFMNEVLRTSIFFTVFPSLECTKDVTVRGYRIPKGAITLYNFWSAHHDPDTYEAPEKFYPCRFLPEQGKPRPELPVSFGTGKRSCSGEGFVMMETFLLLTTIVQNFHLSYSTDSDTSSLFLLSGQLEMCVQTRATV